MKNFDITLYFVTDSTGLSDDEFLEKLEAACRGGVTLVQLREKNRGGRDYLALAIKAKAVTDKYSIPLIIDDRIDVALASGAAGVHVGSSDIPVAEARRLMGNDRIVGATAKTAEAALKAEADGADYLGVGAIYPTTTKVVTVITEVSTLTDICNSVKIPVTAIGGLNCGNIDILKDSRNDGIAVVSAIMKAADPERAAAELKAKFSEMKRGRVI